MKTKKVKPLTDEQANLLRNILKDFWDFHMWQRPARLQAFGPSRDSLTYDQLMVCVFHNKELCSNPQATGEMSK